MFVGTFADKCTKVFLLLSMGAGITLSVQAGSANEIYYLLLAVNV
jgi:hypothetical protein